MIRYKESTTYEDGKVHAELSLASTDAKPTEGIATGSVCVEADTGKTFLYDEAAQTWNEVSTGGGGGGGGGVLVLTETETDVDIFTLNHTWQEIKDADLAVFNFVSVEETGDKYYNKEIALVCDYTEVADPPTFLYEVQSNDYSYHAESPSSYPFRRSM